MVINYGSNELIWCHWCLTNKFNFSVTKEGIEKKETLSIISLKGLSNKPKIFLHLQWWNDANVK